MRGKNFPRVNSRFQIGELRRVNMDFKSATTLIAASPPQLPVNDIFQQAPTRCNSALRVDATVDRMSESQKMVVAGADCDMRRKSMVLSTIRLASDTRMQLRVNVCISLHFPTKLRGVEFSHDSRRLRV